ncbi:cation:proton antiporter [Pseudothauera nasutitermitis]|uniref:Cation:proton antiporter n=1 Tax=Pseudothauera nasutitermitis TaxID=2565930 RepID=A0A4S4AZB7_9RHOO|nr:Na+/H+ antiporter subunit E [Pseudothauera nasutitermitis]THF65508.1 cation:proton antiporter [Pseudothauera nasutitermitis]
MLGVHVLLAVGLAAFADALSPMGVAVAFALVFVLMKLSARLFGMRGYVLRVELGLRFAVWFVLEVLRASLDVARHVLAGKVAISPAVVAVPLIRREDWVVTLLSILLNLTPGTLVLHYAEDEGVLYIHVLDTDSAAAVTDGVRRIEARLLAWLGAGRL